MYTHSVNICSLSPPPFRFPSPPPPPCLSLSVPLQGTNRLLFRPPQTDPFDRLMNSNGTVFHPDPSHHSTAHVICSLMCVTTAGNHPSSPQAASTRCPTRYGTPGTGGRWSSATRSCFRIVAFELSSANSTSYSPSAGFPTMRPSHGCPSQFAVTTCPSMKSLVGSRPSAGRLLRRLSPPSSSPLPAGAAASPSSSPRERTRDLTHGAESAPVEAGSPRSPDQVILEVQPEDLRLVQTRSRQGRSIMEQGAAEVDSMRARRGTGLLHSFSAGDGGVSLLVGSHGDGDDDVHSSNNNNGVVDGAAGGVSDSFSTPSLSPPTTPARGAAAAAAAAAAPEAAATLHGGAGAGGGGGDDGMRLTLSDNTSFLRASLQQLREIAGRTEDLEVEEEEAAVAAAEEASLQRQRSRQPSAAVPPQQAAAAAAAAAAAEEEDLEETLFLEAAESTAA
eukprot:Rhum_TRINITY_DN14409_c33_g1::Rhum_TRINITY_DN14409_c33_g1_i1::g.88486::m.88486